MQTLTIGAYRATLKPTRNVGEFTAKLAKCNGKSRRLPLRDLRTKAGFPVFEPGMSTAEYVRLYSSGDGSQLKAWEWAQLNDAPCTLYSGEDTCETLPDGFETWEDFDTAQSADAAPESTLAAANDDAAPTVPDPEPAAHEEDVAAPVCAPADDEPAETGAAWFERIIAENKAKRDDCEARAQKVAPLDSVPFKHSDGERFGIAGPCMSEPGRFRFSYFDSRGAIGHCTRDTLALAMWEALDLGYLYATEDTAPASPPATHSEPAPARPVYANDYLAWAAVESGRAEPDEYQARVIECFGEVKAGGLFYNSDTYPATAALMTARYGYPDWRGDRGQSDGVQDPFGMDCYRADSVIRARAERERERGAAATFTVGQRFARLIFNDGKQRTAAELVTLDPAGFACKLKAKSGRNSVEITCSAYALSLAVIRAEERGKVLAAKRASARPEPIAPMPAEPAPVPGKSDAAQFDRGRVSLILHNVLVPLQNTAPDGVPSVAGLESEAARLDASAVIMAGDDYADDAQRRCGTRIAADYREVARSLRELAEIERDRIDDMEGVDETMPAPFDGVDVAELGPDGMAEFEQATREQATAPAYRELTTAHYRPQGPCLRIPAFDARAMIPQRFAPVYLLQA